MRRRDTGPLFSLSSEPTPLYSPSKSSIPSVAASIPVCVGREKRYDFGKSGSVERRGGVRIPGWIYGLLTALLCVRGTLDQRNLSYTLHYLTKMSPPLEDKGTILDILSFVPLIKAASVVIAQVSNRFFGGLNIARTRSLSAFIFSHGGEGGATSDFVALYSPRETYFCRRPPPSHEIVFNAASGWRGGGE